MKQNTKTNLPFNIDFFSFFVHELKAPLMHLKWRVEKLKQDPASKMVLSQIEKDCDRLFQMIQDGLDMKQLKSEKAIQPKWCLWKEYINKIQMLLEERLHSVGLNLSVTGEWKELEVYMDPLWMKSVLMNLLNNAIQFSPKGSCIVLNTQWIAQKKITFSITDEGMGIPEDKKEKVFECFYTSRNPSSDRPLEKGTGLGLHIARSIVVAHGGSISIRSNENSKGCTFAVTLPKARKVSYLNAS